MRDLIVMVVGCAQSHESVCAEISNLEGLSTLNPYAGLSKKNWLHIVLRLVSAVDIVFICSKNNSTAVILSSYAQSIGIPVIHSMKDLLFTRDRINYKKYKRKILFRKVRFHK